MKLNPYPEYKDSGVVWLAKVPTHWYVVPNRSTFIEVNDQNHPDEEMLSVTISRGVIKQSTLLDDSSTKDGSRIDRSSYKLVKPGDIAYNKMRAWQGAIGVSTYRGIISPAYVVQRPREGNNPDFLHYLLRTPAFAKEAERNSYGITSDMWSLRPEHFKTIFSCLPPAEEQNAIVRFLDHTGELINRYIRAKERLIALLDEQRQAVIHQAVTRGLDPNAPSKKSGIEWLDDVPLHWQLPELKQVSNILRGKFTHRPRNDPSLYGGIYPFIQTGDVAAANGIIRTHRQTLNQQGLAVSTMFPAGTLVMTIAANIGDVAVLNFEACFPDSIVGFVPTNKVERDFLYYLFRAMKSEFLREAPVNTQGNLNVERIGSKKIPLPSVDEQVTIVRHLAEVTAHIDAGIELAHRQVGLIGEYRTRLIADIVTGQIDVRNATVELPGQHL